MQDDGLVGRGYGSVRSCGRSSGSSWRRGKTCVRCRSKTADTFRRRINASDAAALAEYTLKIALKTDKKSTLFTLPAGKGTGLADGAVLELGLILSAEFFDTEITFIGFVFDLEDKDSANDYTVNHWTIPVALPVVDGTGKDFNGVFTVGYGTSGGGWQDYGRAAAVFE